MSMTNIQLVQKLASESGSSGNSAAVSTVIGQTGNSKRLVGWIKDTHTEIQNKHQDWRWMRSSFTLNTVASDDSYVYTDCTDTLTSLAISRFGHWLETDTDGTPVFKSYLTSTGVGAQNFLTFLSWGEFRYLYKTGTQTNGQPVHFTIDPQNNLLFGPKPDAIYTVIGDYQRAALEFSLDADTPEFPSRFHDIVWAMALEKYGMFHAAPEVMLRGQREGKRLLRQLERDQLPRTSRAGPLA